MKSYLVTLLVGCLTPWLHGGDFIIRGLSSQGELGLTNTYPEGAVTVEQAPLPTGPWQAVHNLFTTGSVASTQLDLTDRQGYFNAAAFDLAPESPNGRGAFTNLTSLRPPDHPGRLRTEP